MRPISAEGFKRPPAPADCGAVPMMQWVAIDQLVVDDAYQRPIYGAGHSNVARIAAGFRWSKFTPIIVSPVAGGKFAVIDGQHRATAAAVLGIESVPAQVIIADQAEQADAFRSINGAVTRVHRLAMQAAAMAAGDPEAKALNEIAAAAGVTILRYPKQATSLEPGETLALGSIADGVRTYGREVVVTALMCVTETENNKPGALSGTVIKALCSVIGGNETWRGGGEALLTLFDAIDLAAELEEARVTRRPKGTALWETFADRVIACLREAEAGDE